MTSFSSIEGVVLHAQMQNQRMMTSLIDDAQATTEAGQARIDETQKEIEKHEGMIQDAHDRSKQIASEHDTAWKFFNRLVFDYDITANRIEQQEAVASMASARIDEAETDIDAARHTMDQAVEGVGELFEQFKGETQALEDLTRQTERVLTEINRIGIDPTPEEDDMKTSPKSAEALMAQVRQLVSKDSQDERRDQAAGRRDHFAAQLAHQRDAAQLRYDGARNQLYASALEGAASIIPGGGQVAKLVTAGDEVRRDTIGALPDGQRTLIAMEASVAAYSGLQDGSEWIGNQVIGGTDQVARAGIEALPAGQEQATRAADDAVWAARWVSPEDSLNLGEVIQRADRGAAAANERDAKLADVDAADDQHATEDAKEAISGAKDALRQLLDTSRTIEAERRNALNAINEL